MASPSLHPASFPHIVEAILANIDDHGTLLCARLVCPAMTPLVDRQLASHELLIKADGSEHPIVISVRGTLPYFSPTSPAAPQRNVMQQARDVTIGATVRPTHRLNSLLAHLSPNASVTIEHITCTSPDFIIPPIRHLTVYINAACNCSETLMSFKHAARYVKLQIEGDSDPDAPRGLLLCGVMRNSYNPGVETMEVWDRNATACELSLNHFMRQLLGELPDVTPKDWKAALKRRRVKYFLYAYESFSTREWITEEIV